MRTLTYFVACSVDGFIAHRDGSHDGFSYDPGYFSEMFAAFPETCPTHFREALGVNSEPIWFDTVLMGRKTYEVGLKDGFTSPYAHLRQYLFSRSMAKSPDPDVTLVSERAIEVVSTLKGQAGKGIWLCGGATLAADLFDHGLIDQLILKVNPFLMGAGIPLFAGVIRQTALSLTHSNAFDNGVVMLYYSIER